MSAARQGITSPYVTIRCPAPGCHHALARLFLRGGSLTLEIVARHHGEHHKITLSLDEASALLASEVQDHDPAL